MTHVPDEFLSAHVDGETLSPSHGVHVEQCATCQERLDQFRHVAVAVGAPVAAPAAHLREAAVAIALDEARGPRRKLVSINRRMPGAAAGTRRLNALGAAAALVFALGAGGYLLSRIGETKNDTSRDATAAAVADAGDLAGRGTSESAGIMAGWHDAGDIGAFDDIAAVETRYREWEAKPQDEQYATGSIVTEPPCPNPADQPTVWQASLTFNGEPAFARLLLVSPESRRLEVLRRTDCGVLASREL